MSVHFNDEYVTGLNLCVIFQLSQELPRTVSVKQLTVQQILSVIRHFVVFLTQGGRFSCFQLCVRMDGS